ncbi:uncharacterized protein lrif1 [Eleginops maclovinus]|uniref:uncharacterized protein lrif1 n=1 Tax=Eleginops maclovinus TaxID=56733 RepID=UPI00308021E6
MNPAIQEMDPVQSNTATFYEAVPAVGPDGTDIMKLIPVQIVNRQFFQYPSSQHETHPTPQRAEAVNISSAPVKMFKANPELCNSVKKYLSQKQKTKLRTIAPSATPAVNIGKSGRVTIQLPVTGKSPELPRGQPSNTQVQTVLTVLAPELPEKPILTSSANASLSSGQPGVVNVLPIKSDSQGVTPQIDSALDTLKLLCNMANKTSCGPLLKGSPHLTLIPKGSRKPNSPMKWVVDEEDSALLPTPDPVNSVTSKILRVVAERENAEKLCDVITKPSHTVEPIASSVASEIIGVAAERENAEKLCDVITKPGPIPEPVPSFVASEILRVAAEREKASKQCDVVTMSVSRCSPGTSVDGMKHMLVIKNRKDPAQQQNSKFISILPKIAGLPRNGEEVGGIPKCPGLGTTVRKSEKLGKPPSQHQVTVKYPLPRGHRLQSPPDTQVGPVLASVVSPAVKKHVLTSSANSRLSPGFHNVVNLSPTTSVNQGGNPQSDSTLGIRKFLRKTSPGPPSKHQSIKSTLKIDSKGFRKAQQPHEVGG